MSITATSRGSRHIETHTTKKSADARHAEVKVNVSRGTHVAPSKSITVADAGKKWADEAELSLERATVKTYREHMRLHINPLLGRYKLTEVSVPLAAQFRDDLRNKGLSETTIQKVTVSLGSLIAYAQERGLVGHNAVRDMRRNRKKGADRHERKLEIGVDIPTPQEVSAILHHAPERWRSLLVTAAFTGLRASELRGLRWEDVDLERGEITVSQRADRFSEIGSPKSKTSRRKVPFGPIVAGVLRPGKLKTGGTGLVFATSKGTIVEHSNLVKASIIPAVIAARLVDKDGKPKYTGLHCLRHSYASWCLNRKEDGGLGFSFQQTKELMGHSSITISVDRYGHLFQREDDGALESAEQALMGLHVVAT